MALADTGKAIGKVTKLLSEHLNVRTGSEINVGRPEGPANTSGSLRLNLFLYEAMFDASLKNVSLGESRPPPLWLVLRYLLTSFDESGNSDTIEAHEQLGEGLRALQELSFLPLNGTTLPADVLPALQDSPEPLKITFDETPSDLLSKLMQGSDEKYRFSMSFQVRPVMIATGEPPSYSLLVGVDYYTTPPTEIGEAAIQIPVMPSLGPSIQEVKPDKFEVGARLSITGSDLNLSNLSVRLGTADPPVTAQTPNSLQCLVSGSVIGGAALSAGSHALSIVQALSTGRRRSSNLLVVSLLPALATVTTSGLHTAAGLPAGIAGALELSGTLLGHAEDDIAIALYQAGKIVKVFDAPLTFTGDQSGLTLQIPDADPVPPGSYRVILQVNGQQAKASPEVVLSA